MSKYIDEEVVSSCVRQSLAQIVRNAKSGRMGSGYAVIVPYLCKGPDGKLKVYGVHTEEIMRPGILYNGIERDGLDAVVKSFASNLTIKMYELGMEEIKNE